MTINTTRRIIIGSGTLVTALTLLVATAAAQTSTTSKTQGAAATSTKTERGTVQAVDGNTIVLKMSTGEFRTVTVDPSRTATVDGKEITVRDLKVGTMLTGTYTTTTTPVTERTVTVASGTIWYANGNTVIATIDGKNKQFTPSPDARFNVNGQMLDVTRLRKGMVFSAEKVVEEPSVQVALNTTITGTMAASAAAPAPAPATMAPAPTMAPAKSTASAPATAAPAAPPATAAAPAKLPKTASPIPMAGLIGLLLTGAGLGLRKLRRS
jgi:hypothetical protein